MELSNVDFIQQVVTSGNLAQISVILVVDLFNEQDIWRACETMAEFNTKAQKELKAVINYGMIATKYDLYEVSV